LSQDEKKVFFPKAYDNGEFLHSSHARTVRILSEYLEPQTRLRYYKIRGTIVFFGSARSLAPEELAEYTERAERKLAHASPDEAGQIQLDLARKGRMTKYYEDATKLSALLTNYFQSLQDARDRFCVCSGAGPGVMEAANRGAQEAGGKTIGLSISLPHEQGVNRFLEPKYTFDFHYFFMRKYWFVYLARGLVVFPGGFGTMDEFFEVLTLVQTQKVRKKLPIVLYGSEYWNSLINFQTMIDWGAISPEDLDLFRVCDTPEQAFEYLKAEVHTHVTEEDEEKVFNRAPAKD
jgi:uncharacterized protein (TIGR00730 family)